MYIFIYIQYFAPTCPSINQFSAFSLTCYLSIHIFYCRNSSLCTTFGLTRWIITHLCVFLWLQWSLSFLRPRPLSTSPFPTFLREPCPLKLSHQSHSNCQTTDEKMFRLGAENKLPELNRENKWLGSCGISNSLDEDRFFPPQDCAVRRESCLFQTWLRPLCSCVLKCRRIL